VDIDPDKLLSRGLTPLDIVNAVNTQNLTLPSGTAKIGDTQYTVANQCDAGVDRRPQHDAGQVRQRCHILLKTWRRFRDGSLVQQNIVREGWPTAQFLLSVIKNGKCLDAGGCQRREEGPGSDPRCPRGRPQDRRAVRPVGIRHQFGEWRAGVKAPSRQASPR